jgi:hypothetical protein
VALNRIACPECGAGLKSASGFTPGQTVSCPKCETYFAVEDAGDATSTATAGKKPVRAAASDDDYDDTPKGTKKRRDEEWSYRNSPARYAVLGVLVLVMCVLGYLLYEKKQREAEDQANNRIEDDPPVAAPGMPGGPLAPPKLGGVGVKMGRPPGGGKGGAAPPLPPPPPLPKKGNTGAVNPTPMPKQGGGGGSPFDLLPGGGSAPNAAEDDMLTKKYRDMLVGTWKADLGKGVTAELAYGADGTVTETVTTPEGPSTRSGKWSVTGLVGRKGIAVSWTGGTAKATTHRLIFEDDELEHPVSSQNLTGIFRKN